MTNQEIAKKYLGCFCSGDIDAIEPLLAPNLSFIGTLHTYCSSAEYLDSLEKDPPERCEHKVLSVTENDDSVAVFYEYQKSDGPLLVAQLFKIKNQKIQEVILVFDSRGFR